MKTILFIAASLFVLNANAETPAATTQATEQSAGQSAAAAKEMPADPQHKDHKHKHGSKCGHKSAKHADHVDYAHDGHQHKAHGDHFDECAHEKTAAH